MRKDVEKMEGILLIDQKLTPHVTVLEYACRCGGCNLGRYAKDINWDILYCFEEIRAAAHNYPFIINSGCRCKIHNIEVVGSLNSSHLRCSALDIIPVGGWNQFQMTTGISKDNFIEICDNIIGDGGLGYVKYGKFGIVHIDRDPELMKTKPQRRW